MEDISQILIKNKRYIITVAQSFNQDFSTTQDLIQEGEIALWNAHKNYNQPEKPFWPYAQVAITNAMKTYLKRFSNTIRTPVALLGSDDVKKTYSLNTPISENKTIADTLADEPIPTIQNENELLKMAIMSLKKEKHKKYLMMWLGIDDEYQETDKLTYQQIADIEGVSRQNIEQIIKKVLKLLKENEEFKRIYQAQKIA
jgi:RNA polymerase sigma factor (sigma-70 family)